MVHSPVQFGLSMNAQSGTPDSETVLPREWPLLPFRDLKWSQSLVQSV